MFNRLKLIHAAAIAAFVFVFLAKSSGALNTSIRSSLAAEAKNYDVVVIGGGSAGLTAAKFAKTFGQSVVIVEGNKMGGDCTWTGCVPSKSLVAAAARHYQITTSNRQSSQPESPADFTAIRKEIQEKIERIYDAEDSPQVMAELGIDVIKGRATLTSPNRLQVSVEGGDNNSALLDIVAQQGIVLCTGARPRIPTTDSISGIDDIDYLTYEQVWELEQLPKRLTIAGGGPIGCELAQCFARLGSKVTVIARELLPESEPEARQLLEKAFQSEGIEIVKGKLAGVERGENPGQHVAICQPGDVRISGDQLLLAVGRIPNVCNMGLDAVGIQLNEQGGILVNDKLQTSVKNVYAAGDCTGDRQFTHYAGFQGAIAARNILLPFSDVGVLPRATVPSTIFTNPQVASVGWSEQDAIQQFGAKNVGVAMKRLEQVSDRSICDGSDEYGMIKVIYRKRDDHILGATIVATTVAGEMISELSVAIKAGLPFSQLATVIHPYPTYSIALQIMAAELYYEKLRPWKPLLDLLKRLGL